jgi:hypothetical protein
MGGLMQVGDRVYATVDIWEDGWWNAPWDLDRDPWRVPQGTEGTIICVEDDYLFEVKFDNGRTCCVAWTADSQMDEDGWEGAAEIRLVSERLKARYHDLKFLLRKRRWALRRRLRRFKASNWTCIMQEVLGHYRHFRERCIPRIKAWRVAITLERESRAYDDNGCIYRSKIKW